jgi:hypothetical protein
LDYLSSIFHSIWFQAGAGLGIIYAVYQPFKIVDENLSAEASTQVAGLLLREPSNDKKRWPDTISTIFEQLFGKSQLSWKCASRSALITCTCVLVIAPWYLLSRTATPIDRDFILYAIPISILVFLVPHYICILATRTCIDIMKRYPPLVIAVLLLLTATFFDYLIVVAVGIFGPDAVERFLDVNQVHSSEPFAGLTRSIDQGIGLMRASMVAASASAVWLWLFVVSGLVFRTVRISRVGFGRLGGALDVKNKPLATLGLVAGVLCAVLWWIYLIIGRIVGFW